MRPVSPSTDTALANAITRPYYLVSIGFSTPEYITSAGSNITYDSNTYVPASVEVSLSAEPNLSIFNEGTTLGATVLADGVAGRTIRIYRGDLNDSNHPNPVMVFEGEGGSAQIGEYVEIRCKPSTPGKTPAHYCAPPVMNHNTPPGTRFRTPKGVVILEG